MIMSVVWPKFYLHHLEDSQCVSCSLLSGPAQPPWKLHFLASGHGMVMWVWALPARPGQAQAATQRSSCNKLLHCIENDLYEIFMFDGRLGWLSMILLHFTRSDLVSAGVSGPCLCPGLCVMSWPGSPGEEGEVTWGAGDVESAPAQCSVLSTSQASIQITHSSVSSQPPALVTSGVSQHQQQHSAINTNHLTHR